MKFKTIKKFLIPIFVVFNIIFLFLSIYLFIISAKHNNTWPFNSGLGNYLPNFIKSYGNKVALSDQKENKIPSHYYSLKLENFSIPSNNATGLGGSVNHLDKSEILVTLDNGEIIIFDTVSYKFSKINNSLKDNYESIRDTYTSKEHKKFFLLAVSIDSDQCREIVLDSYDYQYKNKSLILDNFNNLWISDKMCEESWTGNAGGRILIKNDNLYISIGMLKSGNSGINEYSQNPKKSFGKIIRINKNFESNIYSIGHRNPQGLFLSSNKEILFSTEHGPRGGDELNIIKENNNYGWPCTTLGTHYNYTLNNNIKEIWPLDEGKNGCNSVKTFTEPMYTWTPSIAISQGLQYSGKYFKMFKDNLIIGSLGAETLFKIALSKDNHVINIEKIPINFRVRDLLETIDGKILIYNDSGGLSLLSKLDDIK